MLRKIIKIDEDKCNGCGACAAACHAGAIEMVNGKARLPREDYCDGLGDCLPACPTDAISFEMREAPAYDEAAVLAAKAAHADAASPLPCGCPGTASRSIRRETPAQASTPVTSQLQQWPVQIKLAPVNAPYFKGAHLLIAADCTAYAYGNFHHDFMKNRVTLIGCPKLAAVDYSQKLTEIFRSNAIRSVTLTRMTVPCCGGLALAVKKAIEQSGKNIPLQIVTIAHDGRLLR